ncbi:MAG: bifunctional homocysteine S-methyltransferase/methylenetetrahydrofolate reductase [Anaerolineae bacterium]|nr:bifunctional homocysteine S-methyltransferase/methylenetetrahydrofolate reductase [Anaerolineae bacterium]
MSHGSFLSRIKDKKPILADGAMGTLLHARGVPMNAAFDELNITQPDLVLEVHRAYIKAGADLIETNTFGANRFKLAEQGLPKQVKEIVGAGVALARQAAAEADHDVYVAGSVGPLGVSIQPYGRIKAEEARAAFAEQIGALAEGGVDVIVLETFTNLHEIQEALAAAREVAPDVPVVAEMTYMPDDRTIMGYLPGRVAHELKAAGADIIGVNCSGGPAQIARVLQAMHQAEPDCLFSAMPNAGLPENVNGRTMYPADGTYFADYALTFEALGANIVGGCCGTTPEHIAAMRTALDSGDHPLPQITFLEEAEEHDGEYLSHQSELADKLMRGHFIVGVEMAPPRSHSLSALLTSAEMLREAGADVINVPDSPTARMRMSPWAVCNLIQTRIGLESILHFPTRGRNLLRIQGDLLGAHALGQRNLFVCMGDPTKIGDYPDAMDNYDISPSALIQLIKLRLNHGMDQAGNPIGQPTSFTIGCALNMGAQNPDKEIELLLRKINNGADFALSQPVFEPERTRRFLARYEEIRGEPLHLPIMMGVMPLYNLRHAQFLHNEIPGIDIPAAILKRMEDAGDYASEEGVHIASELIQQMRDVIHGTYIIPAFGKYDLAAQVIDAMRVPG